MKILELMHSDIHMLMTTMFIGGIRYFLTFIDNFSHKILVYMLKVKKQGVALKNGKPWWRGNQSK